MTEGNRRAIAAALIANLGISVAKFVAFMVTGASSMLAEAVHSLADTGNQSLLLLGGRLARQAPTPAHPVGYGRERYFWSFVVALVLFSLGSLFAINEGIDKLNHPHSLASPGWAIGVLLLAIGLEGWSFRTAVTEANAVRRGEGWWQFIRHAKSPELPVVLLEDLGALLGLMIALIGVSAAVVLGEPRYDAMATVAIGILLGAIAIVLATEMKSLLIGEGASARAMKAIRTAVETAPNVNRLIHLRTLHLGPDELLVAVKVALDPSLSFPDVAHTIDTLEQRVRESVTEARVIYVEPDLDHSDPLNPDAAENAGSPGTAR